MNQKSAVTLEIHGLIQHLHHAIAVRSPTFETRNTLITRKSISVSITYHHQDSQVPAAQFLSNVHVLSMRVQATPLIEKFFDSLSTRQHNETFRAQHETIDRTVLTSPLFEL